MSYLFISVTFHGQSLPIRRTGVSDIVVSYGQCESQFLDGHHEGLPPAMAGGQGHASVGEANWSRAGGAQKRSVHNFFIYTSEMCGLHNEFVPSLPCL